MFGKSIFCVVATFASLFFSVSSSFLQVTRITTISQMSSNFSQILPLTAELSALECLKNQYLVLWPSFLFPLVFEKSIFCIVATLALSILIRSSSFLEVTRITSWMISNLSRIRPCTAELAALECLKNHFFSVVATPASSILIRSS